MAQVVHTHRNIVPALTPKYLLPYQCVAVPAATHLLLWWAEWLFTLHHSKNLSPIWRSIFAPLFCAVQPRSVTEIAQPQSFLCVNRSPIRYDFLGGAKTIRYRVNTSLAFRWRVRCGKAYAADNVNGTRANSLSKQKIILSPLKMDITLLKVNMWIFSPQYTVVDS